MSSNSDPRGTIISLHFISEFTRPRLHTVRHNASSRRLAFAHCRISGSDRLKGLSERPSSAVLIGGTSVERGKKSCLHGRDSANRISFRVDEQDMLKIHLLKFRVFQPALLLGQKYRHTLIDASIMFRKIRDIAKILFALQSAKLVRRDYLAVSYD